MKNQDEWMNIAYFQVLNGAGFQAKHESWGCNIFLWKHWTNQENGESLFKTQIVSYATNKKVALPVFENQQHNYKIQVSFYQILFQVSWSWNTKE